jgi:hypoxanthine-guanine phosphoribosyltransferase
MQLAQPNPHLSLEHLLDLPLNQVIRILNIELPIGIQPVEDLTLSQVMDVATKVPNLIAQEVQDYLESNSDGVLFISIPLDGAIFLYYETLLRLKFKGVPFNRIRFIYIDEVDLDGGVKQVNMSINSLPEDIMDFEVCLWDDIVDTGGAANRAANKIGEKFDLKARKTRKYLHIRALSAKPHVSGYYQEMPYIKFRNWITSWGGLNSGKVDGYLKVLERYGGIPFEVTDDFPREGFDASMQAKYEIALDKTNFYKMTGRYEEFAILVNLHKSLSEAQSSEEKFRIMIEFENTLK